MKKIIISLLIVISLVTITACGNDSDKSKYISEVRNFIKDNMIPEWSYDNGKIRVHDDNSITLSYYNVSDWATCATNTNIAILELVKSKDEILKKIPTVTFSCSDSKGLEVGKSVYSNLTDFNKSTLDENAKYYNKNGELLDSDPELVYKELCKEYRYRDLSKNASKYVGKKIELFAKVVKIDDADNYYLLVVNKIEEKQEKGKMILYIRKNLVNEEFEKNKKYYFYGDVLNPTVTNKAYGISENTATINAYYSYEK